MPKNLNEQLSVAAQNLAAVGAVKQGHVMKNKLYILTGGPGAGKTTVLDLLAQQGYKTVPEVARTIIQQQNDTSGNATHTGDQAAFCDLMLDASIKAYKKNDINSAPVFFDRGIPGLLGYADMIDLADKTKILDAINQYRYNSTVFSFPPWEEIYQNDDERLQDFAEAVTTYRYIKAAHETSGYTVLEVPKATVEERVAFILRHLS